MTLQEGKLRTNVRFLWFTRDLEEEAVVSVNDHSGRFRASRNAVSMSTAAFSLPELSEFALEFDYNRRRRLRPKSECRPNDSKSMQLERNQAE